MHTETQTEYFTRHLVIENNVIDEVNREMACRYRSYLRLVSTVAYRKQAGM